MAAEFKDYYTILGVSKTATEKEIRSAYRKLARKYHPDVNPGDKTAEQRFKEINEANEVLSDPEKRKLYDEVGPRWREAQAAGMSADDIRASTRARPSGGQPFGSDGSTYTYRTTSTEDMRDLFGDESPFSDFFYDLFGQSGGTDRAGYARRPTAPVRGADLSHDVDITLEEAAAGTRRILQWQDTAGKMRRIEATIPPGVREGSRVKLSGQGLPGTGSDPLGSPAVAGDLYLTIHLLPHNLFDLQDNDVRVTIPVPLTTAVLGGEATVPTVRGTQLKMKVPAETQNNRIIRLRGQGFPQLNKPDMRGDLLVQVQVVLPTNLSAAERDIFVQLARLGGEATEATREAATP